MVLDDYYELIDLGSQYFSDYHNCSYCKNSGFKTCIKCGNTYCENCAGVAGLCIKCI